MVLAKVQAQKEARDTHGKICRNAGTHLPVDVPCALLLLFSSPFSPACSKIKKEKVEDTLSVFVPLLSRCLAALEARVCLHTSSYRPTLSPSLFFFF
jgi:hypothetical protein